MNKALAMFEAESFNSVTVDCLCPSIVDKTHINSLDFICRIQGDSVAFLKLQTF